MHSTLRTLGIAAAFLVCAAAAHAQTLSSLNMQLQTPDGKQTTVSQLGQGKVTVISFWATWCGPCKKELKAMQPVYDRWKENIQYIAVSIDDLKSTAKVAPYISSKGYTFPVLLDPNQTLFQTLNGTNPPYTLIFAADGSLHSKHEGYLDGDELKLEEELKTLIPARSGSAQ